MPTTPYFLIHEDLLQKNIDEFKIALEKHWPNSQLAFSVKTNSLPWILKYMKANDVFAEVVSDDEYALAEKCGFAKDKIVFNGPIKSKNGFETALTGGTLINIDSQHELRILDMVNHDGKDRIGIRINVNTDVFKSEDIGYEETGFRFGFSEKNGALKNAVETVKRFVGSNRIGLHIHCNSITRSVAVYEAISLFAVRVIKEYDLDPLYIDVGGGFFGGVEDKPSADLYIGTITSILSTAVDTTRTKLIIEPGSALVGSAIDLYTSVLDVKDTDRARIVTTDGSRIHIDPLWKKSRYKYHLVSKTDVSIMEKQIICGYTCMDHDRIMELKCEPELKIGDTIIYERVGAYTMTFGGPFISMYPEVYVKSNAEMILARNRMSIEQYYDIHSNEEQ